MATPLCVFLNPFWVHLYVRALNSHNVNMYSMEKSYFFLLVWNVLPGNFIDSSFPLLSPSPCKRGIGKTSLSVLLMGRIDLQMSSCLCHFLSEKEVGGVWSPVVQKPFHTSIYPCSFLSFLSSFLYFLRWIECRYSQYSQNRFTVSKHLF